jgi:hypothetical protein
MTPEGIKQYSVNSSLLILYFACKYNYYSGKSQVVLTISGRFRFLQEITIFHGKYPHCGRKMVIIKPLAKWDGAKSDV